MRNLKTNFVSPFFCFSVSWFNIMWENLVAGMNQFLLFLYTITGNYGIAIIILTVLIKIVITPLTYKQFKAMKDMYKLQPYLKELQQKYKNNPRELQKRMMGLYKEHKINPFGGCLLLLIQMPILILLYQTIMVFKDNFAKEVFLWSENISSDLYLFTQTGFLWIPTLLSPDIFLLILYTVSMYVSQKITIIPTGDPTQQQTQNMMAIMMPIMFAIIFRTFPSAFILYWFVFNILSTTEQYFLIIRPTKRKLK